MSTAVHVNYDHLEPVTDRRSKEVSREALRLEVQLLEEQCATDHERTMVRLTARVVAKFLLESVYGKRAA